MQQYTFILAARGIAMLRKSKSKSKKILFIVGTL